MPPPEHQVDHRLRVAACRARTPGPSGRARRAASSAAPGSTPADPGARRLAAPWPPRATRRRRRPARRPPGRRPPRRGPPPGRPTPTRSSEPSAACSTSPAATSRPSAFCIRAAGSSATTGDVVGGGRTQDEGGDDPPAVLVGQQPDERGGVERRGHRSVPELGVDEPDQLLAVRVPPHVLGDPLGQQRPGHVGRVADVGRDDAVRRATRAGGRRAAARGR